MKRRDFLKCLGGAALLPVVPAVAANQRPEVRNLVKPLVDPVLAQMEVGRWQGVRFTGVNAGDAQLSMAAIRRAQQKLDEMDVPPAGRELYLFRTRSVTREQLEREFPGVQVREFEQEPMEWSRPPRADQWPVSVLDQMGVPQMQAELNQLYSSVLDSLNTSA